MINIQICNEYIDTKILLSFNKIFIQMKIYLIDNFQSNFIINMNVLNKNDMNFLLIRQALKIKNIEILLCYISFISFITQLIIYIH